MCAKCGLMLCEDCSFVVGTRRYCESCLLSDNNLIQDFQYMISRQLQIGKVATVVDYDGPQKWSEVPSALLNMLSIGAEVARRLEAGGVTAIQDRSLHDYPSYNGSYTDARKSIRKYLAEYPTIRLVLDLHRDAADTPSGQLRTLASTGAGDCAQLMLVMGSSASGRKHPDWEQNLSLALKLQAVLERNDPGITRSTVLRAQRFNQDLSPGCLLVEVGAAGNTHAEALRAADALAEGILALAAENSP